MEIIPGILEKEWGEIERKINLVLPFTKTVHVDLLDGKFAANTTFLDPFPFSSYTKKAVFELHMMVDEPINFLQPFADAGFQRFLGHIEKMSDQESFVAKAQTLGEVGFAIDGLTSIDAIKVPFEDLDSLLVMSIKAGFSGQQFTPEFAQKIAVLRSKTSLPIEVDGGINDTTIVSAKNLGASRFVTTSFLFKNKNPRNQYGILTNCLQ